MRDASAPPPSSPRTRLGISLDDAAGLIGCSRPTLTLYEVNPLAVGIEVRTKIAAFYRDLERCAARALKRHGRRRRHGRRVFRASVAVPVPATEG